MKKFWRFVKSIFSFIWRLISWLRSFSLNLIFIFIVLLGLGIYAQINKETGVPQNGVLLVNLAGKLVEQTRNDNLLTLMSNDLLGGKNRQLQETSVFQIVDLIRQAKDDDNIKAIVLSLEDFVGGNKPSLDYVGKALLEFSNAGKPVYAIGNNYTQSQYYLASFAEHVYLTPQGSVNLTGIATNNLYFRSLLDNIKAKTYIFRVGTYKSAVEPYLLDSMSDAARQNTQLWVNGMWQSMSKQIANNRNIKQNSVLPDADTLYQDMLKVAGDTSAYAIKANLVDQLISADQFEKFLSKKYGSRDNTYQQVSIYDYRLKPQLGKNEQIGVVLVNGAIVDGDSTPDTAGSNTIVAQLRQARHNPQVKAVILRVNSPGGSVTASELIRSELATLRASGKPVVVSMGGMAASGGYWISTPAEHIIASPDTLTGSIGIFGLIPTFEETLRSIGVFTDGVATSPLAGVTLTRDIPDSVARLIQLQIEHGYTTFIKLVADSRHKKPEEIDKVAQGQVWIGSDAKNLGLVDQLGDFDDAVIKTSQLAKLNPQDIELTWFQPQPTLFETLFGQFNAQIQALLPQVLQAHLPAPVTNTLMAVSQQQSLFEQIKDPRHQYIYCMDCSYIQQ